VSDFEFHPLATFFPLIEGDDFQRLIDDIRENELQEDIVLFEGKILDGRNRYRACRACGVEPRFEEYTGDNPLAYVISLNIKRRHLEKSQCAMIAVDLEGFRHGGNRQDANSHLDRATAAKMCGVGVRSVADARTVKDLAAPELQQRVRAGGVAIYNAAFLAQTCSLDTQRKLAAMNDADFAKAADKLRKKKTYQDKIGGIRARGLVIPEGRFNVIVMDPAWDLKLVAPDVRGEEPGLQYPTMSLDEIRKFGLDHFFPNVRTFVDCHLFLWTVHHFLPDAFDLLKAWGFAYARTFTWHKNTVQGHEGQPGYNSEFVLHGRRGSPRFDHIKGSGFVTCFNGLNLGHSRKPNEFYEMICKVTEGRRIDVFSRSAHDGFEPCGNETDKFALPKSRGIDLEGLDLDDLDLDDDMPEAAE
jgi:N6-adenosine-specific RNA methylase IME4